MKRTERIQVRDAEKLFFFVGAVGPNGSRLQNARALSFTSSGLFIFGSSLSIWLEISSTLKPYEIPGYFHGYK